MWPHHAINTLIEDLLGDPLADLSAIGRNAHEGRNRWGQAAGAQYLPAIQHKLQAVA